MRGIMIQDFSVPLRPWWWKLQFPKICEICAICGSINSSGFRIQDSGFLRAFVPWWWKLQFPKIRAIRP